MSEDKITTVMAVTGRDRQTVMDSLSSCSGDMAAAVNIIVSDWERSKGQGESHITIGSNVIQQQSINQISRKGGRLGLDPSDEYTEEAGLGEYTEAVGEIMDRHKVTCGESEYLVLKVVQPLEEEDEIHFRVKRSICLGKLKRSYSEKMGVHSASLRFLYDGLRVNDNHTPGCLGIESGDYIEVYTDKGEEWNTAKDTTVRRETAHVEVADDMALNNVIMVNSEGNKSVKQCRKLSQEGDEIPILAKRIKQSAVNVDVRIEERDAVREELDRIRCKYDDLVGKLRDKVECPVCLDVPKKAPVPVCPNGHVVCLRCVREECPTCRARMEQGKSTLAVTVIENIEHQCDNEGCEESYPLVDLVAHERQCSHRLVQCPGLDCNTMVSLSSLSGHLVSCCVERGEIKELQLPHTFRYMINEDVEDLVGERQNSNWRLEAIRFDGKIFLLKVTRNGRWGRWLVFVQMAGGQNLAVQYGVQLTLFRPGDGVDGKYSLSYSGDVCPIDVGSVEEAENLGLCITLRDRGMGKFFVKNVASKENEFFLSVNIFKHL